MGANCPKTRQVFSDDVGHFCLDLAWIGLPPVEESEPVFASPSGKDCTNAGKEEFYIITKCAILLKLIQQCYSAMKTNGLKKNLPEAENSDNGNKDWFLHIFQARLVKQSGEDTLRSKNKNSIR